MSLKFGKTIGIPTLCQNYLVLMINIPRQTMLFYSPQHGFSSFGWRLQIKSLYSQSLLVHELKFPGKKM